MKILCMMTSIGYSGAPRMMAWLANGFSDLGHEVSLVTFYDDEDHQTLSERIDRIALNVSRTNHKLVKVFRLMRIQIGLFAAVKKKKPDLVVAFSNLPSGMFLWLKKVMGCRVIVSERGDPFMENTPAMNWVRKQYTKADGVVFQTEGAKQYFSEKRLRNTFVIPNPVTYKPINRCRLEDRKPEIAFVGRFHLIQKRQDVFLEALKIVLGTHPDYSAVMYGDGEDLDTVKQMATHLGIEGKVLFPGQVDRICERIHDAGLFALSSDYEGIPNSLMEAMIAGVPVVSTDCSPGGASLLISNRVNGLLVQRGNAEALADGMNYLIEHPDEAESFAGEAQKIAERFAPKAIMELWQNAICEVCK